MPPDISAARHLDGDVPRDVDDAYARAHAARVDELKRQIEQLNLAIDLNEDDRDSHLRQARAIAADLMQRRARRNILRAELDRVEELKP